LEYTEPMQNIHVDVDLARRLEQSISLAPMPTASDVESFVCGPFRTWLMSYTDNHELNYAMPVAPTDQEMLGSALDVLRAEFAVRRRVLRIEFVEELWPGLADALLRAGLHEAAREPLMACAKSRFTPVTAPGVSVTALAVDDGDADLAAFAAIREGQSMSRSPSGRAIAALRETLRAGSEVCALAHVDGRPAAAGRCILQSDELGEITSIVTLPQFRRRGVGATLVSYLIRQLIEAGGSIAWLNAANEQAVSVYARLGFRAIGSLLSYEDGVADRGT
jgi:ribosomal protein S18 acetylase RimI-like enzyme